VSVVVRRARFVSAALLAGFGATAAHAQPFQLPTANRALFEADGGDRFFVGTVGRDWRSGMFGCVRSDGWQMHEGIDIKCLQRDKAGEPIDPVGAAAGGVVAYLNDKPGLSNYGNYLVLRHRIESLDVCTLYAHLREIRPGLRVGQSVRAGEIIGTLGRTANTSQGISKERAHLHFEITFQLNERFSGWHAKHLPGQRNDHGDWNGRNLAAIDPVPLFYAQRLQGSQFSFLEYMRERTELCRVLVRATDFPWQRRNRPLVKRNTRADREGFAGYEIALDYNGVPFQLIPRAASEIPGQDRIQLLSVNEKEYQAHPCGKLVVKRGQRWELTAKGTQLIELIVH
jgi:peptidoglycan LD-endopeptidase LytH